MSAVNPINPIGAQPSKQAAQPRFGRMDLSLDVVVDGIGRARDFLEPGNHAHQIAERAHLLDRFDLLGEVGDGELILLEFALKLLGLGLIVILLRLLDEREHIAHPEDA